MKQNKYIRLVIELVLTINLFGNTNVITIVYKFDQI